MKIVLKEYRELLLQLAQDDDATVRARTAETVAQNFEKLPERYRELLLQLAQDDDATVRASVSFAIGKNYSELPLDYRGILKKFQSDSIVLSYLKESKIEHRKYDWTDETVRVLKRELGI